MASIHRISVGLVLLIALSSFTVAYDSGSKGTPASSCGSGQFWWADPSNDRNSRCLPSSPRSLPSPPQGNKCPESGDNYSWYYHSGNDGCVPTIPYPPSPRCPSDCDLDNSSNMCLPHSRPPAPQPSGQYERRSELKSRDVVTLCPVGLDACPILGLTSSDYECVDTQADLESCGGCASIGEGDDCSAIDGAWNVGCENGVCIIYTCAAGFRRAYDGKSCIAH